MSQALLKTRFAPSPTGLIHIGNARTALFSALLGDSFLLRIEDTDTERSRPEYTQSLIEDLKWLGLQWLEGPQNLAPDPRWFQSLRAGVYDPRFRALEEAGYAYPCFCSPLELELQRKVQAASGAPPRYSGKCARLGPEERLERLRQGLSPTLRFKVPRGEEIVFEDGVRGLQKFMTDDIGDFIIRRADGTAAFFFSNAIDDSLMNVDLVVRGEDHLSNTPRQILILKSLSMPIPSYAHTAMVLGEDGAPLSKRNGSRSLSELREAGYFPLAILNLIARLGHHFESEELLDMNGLKKGFRMSALGKSPARFDALHLRHWQSLAIRASDDETLGAWLEPEANFLVPADMRSHFMDLVRGNCLFPSEASLWARILFSDDALAKDTDLPPSDDLYRAALDAHRIHPEDYSGFMDEIKQRSSARGKALFMPLRLAMTGRSDGPELALIYRLMPSGRMAHRLASPIAMD